MASPLAPMLSSFCFAQRPEIRCPKPCHLGGGPPPEPSYPLYPDYQPFVLPPASPRPHNPSESPPPHSNGSPSRAGRRKTPQNAICSAPDLSPAAHHVPLIGNLGERVRGHDWAMMEAVHHGSQAGAYGLEFSSACGLQQVLDVKNIPHDFYSRPHNEGQPSAACSGSPSPPSIQNSLHFSLNSAGPGYERGYTSINHVLKPLNGCDHASLDSTSTCAAVSKSSRAKEHSSFHTLVHVDSLNQTIDAPAGHQQPWALNGTKTRIENEKRFPCPECGRMFARAFNMETHRKTHNGYRPHHCPECKKGFSRRHDLHRHLASVHKEPRKQFNQQAETIISTGDGPSMI